MSNISIFKIFLRELLKTSANMWSIITLILAIILFVFSNYVPENEMLYNIAIIARILLLFFCVFYSFFLIFKKYYSMANPIGSLEIRQNMARIYPKNYIGDRMILNTVSLIIGFKITNSTKEDYVIYRPKIEHSRFHNNLFKFNNDILKIKVIDFTNSNGFPYRIGPDSFVNIECTCEPTIEIESEDELVSVIKSYKQIGYSMLFSFENENVNRDKNKIRVEVNGGLDEFQYEVKKAWTRGGHADLLRIVNT